MRRIESLQEYCDFLAVVLLSAPDDFLDEGLPPEESLNLERAYRLLDVGLEHVRKYLNDQKYAEFVSDLKRSQMAFEAGDEHTGAALIQKLMRDLDYGPKKGTSMNARDELNSLLDKSIRMALQLVERHGSHMPFAIGVTADGEINNIAADDSELPGADVLYERTTEYVKEAVSVGHLRAVALARNIELTSNVDGTTTDAVEVTLDHINDDAVTCCLPYQLSDGKIIVGEMAAKDADISFFA